MPKQKHPHQSEKFLAALKGAPRVRIITHNTPDPDGIASGWALLELIREKLGIDGELMAGGAVDRAENLQMLKLCQPPLKLVNELPPQGDAAIILVDCHPDGNNHLLSGSQQMPAAVIDHHATRRIRSKTMFTDLRSRLAATATIASQYLRRQCVPPSPRLATALLYALRSDTRTAEATFTRPDKSAVTWLTAKADLEILADIENAPLPRAYYTELIIAMQNTFIYEDAAICFLPQAHGPEIIAEVADELVRCDQINQVLCGALIKDNVFLSVRTTQQGGDANQLIQVTLDDLGQGGGHEHRAGGKIPDVTPNHQLSETMQAELRSRWLAACGIKTQRGIRLVPRHKILENL